MNLKLLGRIIQAIFLATVYLGWKMSPIVICNAVARTLCKNKDLWSSHGGKNICT